MYNYLSHLFQKVVKSRIQGAGKPAPGQIAKYNWTYPAFVHSLLEYF